MNGQMEVLIAGGIAVPLFIATVPGLWHLHKWLSRLERSVSVVEARSQQLEPNGGSHVGDLPEVIRRVEKKIDAVRDSAATDATASRKAAELAVTTSALAVQAVERMAGDVRNVQNMITLHLAAGHKEHVVKEEKVS
jgi:hypothetical protein